MVYRSFWKSRFFWLFVVGVLLGSAFFGSFCDTHPGEAAPIVFASGHTATNIPDLFRTPKSTVAGPGQYWGGGPPGKPLGCC